MVPYNPLTWFTCNTCQFAAPWKQRVAAHTCIKLPPWQRFVDVPVSETRLLKALISAHHRGGVIVFDVAWDGCSVGSFARRSSNLNDAVPPNGFDDQLVWVVPDGISSSRAAKVAHQLTHGAARLHVGQLPQQALGAP
jgi:hypothetical protein